MVTRFTVTGDEINKFWKVDISQEFERGMDIVTSFYL